MESFDKRLFNCSAPGLKPGLSKYVAQTSSIDLIWELIRNAKFQTQSWTYCVRKSGVAWAGTAQWLSVDL